MPGQTSSALARWTEPTEKPSLKSSGSGCILSQTPFSAISLAVASSIRKPCSIHFTPGSYAIIGAHLPIACGAALRAQYRGDSDVTVCFFGDGTTNIGAFHEALNFAAVWKLPVIFVCENNLYME